jgi:biopolymer transport protein ExbB
MLDLFLRGGFAMYPLLLCSVISLAIILERLWYFVFQIRGDGDDVYEATMIALKQGRPLEAMQALRRKKGPVAAILTAAVSHSAEPPAITEDAVARAGREAVFQMERGLSMLDAIVTMAPLLGLLGTVTGIIKTFNVIGNLAGVTTPADMGPGIAEALFTTAFGLMIAVPTMAFYAYFSHQVEKRILLMNNRASEVLKVLLSRGEQA